MTTKHPIYQQAVSAAVVTEWLSYMDELDWYDPVEQARVAAGIGRLPTRLRGSTPQGEDEG